jgi:hypothetical protein
LYPISYQEGCSKFNSGADMSTAKKKPCADAHIDRITAKPHFSEKMYILR